VCTWDGQGEKSKAWVYQDIESQRPKKARTPLQLFTDQQLDAYVKELGLKKPECKRLIKREWDYHLGPWNYTHWEEKAEEDKQRYEAEARDFEEKFNEPAQPLTWELVDKIRDKILADPEAGADLLQTIKAVRAAEEAEIREQERKPPTAADGAEALFFKWRRDAVAADAKMTYLELNARLKAEWLHADVQVRRYWHQRAEADKARFNAEVKAWDAEHGSLLRVPAPIRSADLLPDGFQVFQKLRLPAAIAQVGGVNVTQAEELVRQRWEALSDERKASFEKQAADMDAWTVDSGYWEGALNSAG